MRELLKRIGFCLISHLFHQPRLLRFISAAFRRWPWLNRASPSPMIASRDGVHDVMARSADFSHHPHLSNLVAGEFVIGMDDGPRMAADRALLLQWLNLASPAGNASAAESQSRVARFKQDRLDRIELVEDYLIWVVWAELKETLGRHVDSLLVGDASAHSLLMELRQLGAHLVIGGTAPARIQERAERSALAVQRRVDRALDQLVSGFDDTPDRDAVRRNAIGMMWVGHPATVQAGALVVQELFARPGVLATLAASAAALRDRAWSDTAFRQEVRRHILELLRFRPVFPFLPRLALRDTWCNIGSGQSMLVRAGTPLIVSTIGAMFDADVMREPGIYHAGRYEQGWGRYPKDDLLMFGLGGRSCVAQYLVVDIVVSATIGLLQLPNLRWPARRLLEPRIGFDGMIIASMPVSFDTPST